MTKFRFGGRRVPGQHANAPGRVHGIVPQNAGIAHVAQQRIDALTSAATRKAKEAISGIDAVRLFIYQPIKHGPQCNCGTAVQDTALIPASDEDTFEVPDTTDVAGDIKPRLKVRAHDVTAYDRHVANMPANEPDHNFGLTEDDILGDGPPTSTSDTNGPRTGEMHGSGNLFLHSGEYDHEVPDQVEDTYGEVELLADWEDGDDAFNPDSVLADSAYVMGGAITTCPVCMGSGLLGGYSLFGATRLVLSSANATGGNNLGAEVPAKSPLPIFDLGPGETVEWGGLNFPNYYSMGWAIARNMRRRIGLAMEYTLDGAQWKPIGNLEADNQVNLATMVIRVRNDSDESMEFSHLEIVVFHNAVLGQVSNFNQNAGLADAVKGDGLSMTFPPEVGLVDRNALVADAKYNLMWRVVSVMPILTAKRQLINCEASTELMQPTFVETIMYPAYSIEDQKTLSYGGIEPVQGAR